MVLNRSRPMQGGFCVGVESLGGVMERIIKSITGSGELYALCDGNRYKAAKCKASIEIREEAVEVPMLGRGRIIKRRYAVVLLTFDHAPTIHVNLKSVSGFSFVGDFLRKDGVCAEMRFPRCLLLSDLDLTASGECTFEIPCSNELLKRLQRM